MTSWGMHLALQEAEQARGRTSPRPPVGAVLVRDGVVVGRGYTQPGSGPHAEIMALREASERAHGATLYCTLEPCSHYGKTPPCADALIAAGVTRVVAAQQDPNPLVAGQGFTRLRAHGIAVEVGDGAAEAWGQLAPFFTYITKNRAWVTAKWAMSLDGKIATRTGSAHWISDVASRGLVHEMRDTVDAIMVGIGTAIADDPQLTVRLPATEHRRPQRLRPPWRVIVDARGRIPLDLKVACDALAASTVVVTTAAMTTEKEADLIDHGVSVLRVAATDMEHVDLSTALTELTKLDICHVLVEGGAGLLGGLLDCRLIDEVRAFIAPLLLGGEEARPVTAGRGVATIADGARVRWTAVHPLERDVLLEGYVEYQLDSRRDELSKTTVKGEGQPCLPAL